MTVAEAKNRLLYLDFLKGLAIISVILLHMIPRDGLLSILAPFHIWQAVPIFLFVAGITASISLENSGSLKAYYRKTPITFVHLFSWYLFSLLVFVLMTRESLSLRTVLLGLAGPGGYFVPLILQHIFLFPLALFIKKAVNNDCKFLLLMLAASVAYEFFAGYLPIAEQYYRCFYPRYLFIASLGAVLHRHARHRHPVFIGLAAMSALYILSVVYFGFALPYMPTTWLFQNYPSYFYTALICMLLATCHERIPFSHAVCRMGKSSYFIYLVQLVFFPTLWTTWHNYTIFRALIALPFCTAVGMAIDYAIKRYAAYKKSVLTSRHG